MSAKRNLLIGLGVGLVVGILYAPHKGSKTRKLVARRGSELRDGWENLKETLSSVFEKSDEIKDEFIEGVSPNAAFVSAPVQDEWSA